MRSIKLKKINSLTFQIIGQTYIDFKFNEGSSTFLSSNGLSLWSASVPEVDNSEVVFVRGTHTPDNNNHLVFENQEDVNRFLFAVNEYNIGGCQCNSAILCTFCMTDIKGAISF